jgi:hypothetical protein
MFQLIQFVRHVLDEPLKARIFQNLQQTLLGFIDCTRWCDDILQIMPDMLVIICSKRFRTVWGTHYNSITSVSDKGIKIITLLN